jgi:phosphoesterase RecJ-like protein
MFGSLQEIAKIIESSQSILLSTHREPDGDGLGAQIALYYALKKMGKNVRILNVDASAQKYDFLIPKNMIQVYQGPHDKVEKTDIALIVDTNDKRLLDTLFVKLEVNCTHIAFIDHHPVLINGPKPSDLSVIDTKAASTGEIAFELIKLLKVPLDKNIAEALYTSLVFDTQLFKFIRNSSSSHLMAAELLRHDIQPERVHRALFGDFTKSKLMFNAKSLNSVEFHSNDQVAFLKFYEKDLETLGLNKDHTKDIIDTIMNIDTIEAALVVREIKPNEFKLSFRSKGKIQVLKIAEEFGGGGHLYAAGSYAQGDLEDIKIKSINYLSQQLKNLNEKGSSNGTKT